METRSEQAQRLHEALVGNIGTLRQAEKSSLNRFSTLYKERLYRELGYSSIHAYGRDALGFSDRKISAFIRMADAFEKLPATKRAVDEGELTWTKAREIVSVATPGNENSWLEEARNSSRRELEQKVKRSRPRSTPRRLADREHAKLPIPTPPGADRRRELESAAPLRIDIAFTHEQYGRWEALLECLRKQGHTLSKEELLMAALENLADEEARPRGRTGGSPYKVILRRCPDCGETAMVTGRGELALDSATTARVTCDEERLAPGGEVTRSLTPRKRRQVLARDGHRCQGPGCRSTRFLEVHHLTPRRLGGSNAPTNLVTLCARCHQLVHERGNLPGVGIQTALRPGSGTATPRGSPLRGG